VYQTLGRLFFEAISRMPRPAGVVVWVRDGAPGSRQNPPALNGGSASQGLPSFREKQQ
jgi:hypothetical protein